MTEKIQDMQVRALIPIDLPDQYTANVGDLLQVLYAEPGYPKSDLSNIHITAFDTKLLDIVAIVKVPAERIFGASALAAFLLCKAPGTVTFDTVPVDSKNQEVQYRRMTIGVTITIGNS